MRNENDNKICALCENACRISDESKMLCNIHGVVSKSYSCKKFSFDPIKHEPPRSAELPELELVNID